MLLKHSRWIAIVTLIFFLSGCKQRALTPAFHTPLRKTAVPKSAVSPTTADAAFDQGATPFGGSALSAVTIPLSAGGVHTCLTTGEGSIRCWGGNEFGQLGNGTTGRVSLMVEIPAFTEGTTAVEAGKTHTCALDARGKIWCWGDNARGQLGDGTTEGRYLPTAVELGADAVMLAAGNSFTCALTASGGVQCWGWNIRGQLGDKTFEDRAFPSDVIGLDGGAAAIAAGEEHACALLAEGGIRCWGLGSDGQLGSGRMEVSNKPVDVIGLPEGAVGVAAGGAYSCALTVSGKVYCWGRLGGQWDEPDSLAAVEIEGLRGEPVSVEIGSHYACARSVAGGVECWGSNILGQLGDGSDVKERSRPAEVLGFSGAVSALAAGDSHACAKLQDGRILCWGDNFYWQLGNIGPHSSSVPVDVDADAIHYYYSGIEAAAPPAQYPQQHPSLWELTEESTDLSAPGVKTYAVSVQRGSSWSLDYFLCAQDEPRLETMLSVTRMMLLVDYQPISERAILIFRRNFDSWACQSWTTTLSRWERDRYELAIVYTFAQEADDGENTYPAGEYWRIFMVAVEE